jgi:hypothetical protein
MRRKITVDDRPAPYYNGAIYEWDETDTKPLRRLQYDLNLYIDKICTGEDTGLEVWFLEVLLREISRDDFQHVHLLGDLLDTANSAGPNTVAVLNRLANAIARKECTVDGVARVFGCSATAWKFGQLSQSSLFDQTTCWREYDVAWRARLDEASEARRDAHMDSGQPENNSQSTIER